MRFINRLSLFSVMGRGCRPILLYSIIQRPVCNCTVQSVIRIVGNITLKTTLRGEVDRSVRSHDIYLQAQKINHLLVLFAVPKKKKKKKRRKEYWRKITDTKKNISEVAYAGRHLWKHRSHQCTFGRPHYEIQWACYNNNKKGPIGWHEPIFGIRLQKLT